MGGKEGKPASPEETKAFYYSETYLILFTLPRFTRSKCVDIEKLKAEFPSAEKYCGY